MATGVYSPGMDRIWQWAWDRHGSRYSWAVTAVSYFSVLPVWLFSAIVVVAFEESDRYVAAAAATLGIVLVLLCVCVLPGVGPSRIVERWAAGGEIDRAKALEATYTWVRGSIVRVVGATAVSAVLIFAVVGAIAGATGSRLVQYGIVGAVFGAVVSLATVHSFVEAACAAGQGRHRR